MKKSRIKLVTIIVLAVVMLVSCDGNTMTDIDGNTYQTIQIGTQIWTTTNLKVTHYRNGDAILTGYSNSEWSDLDDTETGAYAVYDNNETNADTYGYLYNWYAVDDRRNIAPEGWHIPSDQEWQILVDFLGESVAAGKMQESGFTAHPGGYRNNYDGNYYAMGSYGYFWSSTVFDDYGAWSRALYYHSSEVRRSSYGKSYGFAIRLLRD